MPMNWSLNQRSAICLALCAGIFFVLCQRAYAESSTTEVLALFPLTGADSRQGQLAEHAIRLALEETKSVHVTFQDTRAETKEAVNGYRQALTGAHPDAVLTIGSPSAMALSPLVNRDKIYLFSLAASPAYTSADDYTFRIIGSAAREAEFLSNVVKSRLKSSKIGIIKVENDYGVGTAGAFKAKMDPARIVAEESYLPQTIDMRVQLLRLRTKQPDLLYIAAWGHDAGLIIAQAREMGMKIPVLCSQACLNPDLLTPLQNGHGEIVITSPQENGGDSFRRRFREQFSEPPTFVAARMYLMVKMIDEVFRRCEHKTDCVRAAFYGKTPENDLPYVFDNNGEIDEHFIVKRVENREFVDEN